MCKWSAGLVALVATVGLVACKEDASLSGTVTAPEGGDVAGTVVSACFLQSGTCVPDSSHTRQVRITTGGASAVFRIEDLAEGSYVVLATKDVNGDGLLGPGDYQGTYSLGTTGRSTPVTPPRAALGITLGHTGDGVVTVLRPADFTGLTTGARTASVTLRGLSSTERVVVIPVHATQASFATSTPDGLAYDVTARGTVAQALPTDAPAALALPAQGVPTDGAPRSLVPAPAAEGVAVARSEAHLAVLADGLAGLEALRRAGAQSLVAPGTVRAQQMGKCPARKEGDVCRFWVLDGDVQVEVPTRLSHVSTSAYWFLDDETTNALTLAELQALALRFESEVLPPNRRYFGDFADVDANQKVIIVFSRLLGPRGLLGYVHPLDYFGDAVTQSRYDGFRSNEGDIFYAATPNSLGMGTGTARAEYLRTTMPSTMVHELKHLMATGRRLTQDRPPEELWLEEGSAMAAQELAGMGSQLGEVQGYARFGLARPQDYRVLHTTRPDGREENLSIYGYNFLLLWRVAERKGHDTFWKAWTVGDGGTTSTTFSGVGNLQRHAGKPLPELMVDWATTLVLDDNPFGIQGYDYASLNLRGTTWQPLGYTALTGTTSGAARSMAYHVGRGTGGDATITVNVTRGEPYAVVLRLPGALPWAEARDFAVSGTLTAAPGRTVAGARIVACELVAGSTQCGPKSRALAVSATTATHAYTLPVQAGTYQFFADVDANGNGTPEYEGCFNGCADTVIGAARTGVNITLVSTGQLGGAPDAPTSLRALTPEAQGLLRSVAANHE